MNEGQNFLTIDALSSLINQKVKRIQKGNLKIQMLEQLLDEVRELQERLIIIKYKAMEKVAKPSVEKNLFSVENFEPQQSEALQPTLNFKLNNKSEKIEVPENQISLIDSIEELSKEEKVRRKKLKEERKRKKEEKKKRKKEAEESANKKELAQSMEKFESPANLEDSKSTTEKAKEVVKEDAFSPLEKSEIIFSDKPTHLEIEKHVEKNEPKEKSQTKITPIQKSSKTTLSQKIRKTHIDSIAKAIKLNQRIGMIKKLFGGDDELFKSEIKNLNEAVSLQAANNHLEKLRNTGQWKEEDQWYILLTQLVERRHS